MTLTTKYEQVPQIVEMTEPVSPDTIHEIAEWMHSHGGAAMLMVPLLSDEWGKEIEFWNEEQGIVCYAKTGDRIARDFRGWFKTVNKTEFEELYRPVEEKSDGTRQA